MENQEVKWYPESGEAFKAGDLVKIVDGLVQPLPQREPWSMEIPQVDGFATRDSSGVAGAMTPVLSNCVFNPVPYDPNATLADISTPLDVHQESADPVGGEVWVRIKPSEPEAPDDPEA